MQNKLTKYSEKIFENIKHVDKNNIEFWYARELQEVLEYIEWRNFLKAIEKAKVACKSSKNTVFDHFVEVNKTIKMPKGATKEIEDYILTRYACYLIVQNGDPKKEAIALGQTYFAVQTRKQEIVDNFQNLSEEQKRLAVRKEMIEHNKSLAEAANLAGVETPKDYAIFQNHGYKGLYGGLGQKEIHNKKGLKKSEKILDFMGSTELAANLFRATQTDEKLRNENIKSKDNANKTHHEVGKKVRTAIKDIGGTMPEDLPTPKESIKKIEKKFNTDKKLENKSSI